MIDELEQLLEERVSSAGFTPSAAPMVASSRLGTALSRRPPEELFAPKPSEGAQVRITVDLDSALHRRLSIYCAEKGLSKSDLIRTLLAARCP